MSFQVLYGFFMAFLWLFYGFLWLLAARFLRWAKYPPEVPFSCVNVLVGV
jgi:hypothetical protein